ncbi:MAG: deoxyribose-phosphate aldolase [Chloroflexi bacterium]|nr:deoxyribose-phosphate aldolase [Chloroflexota bacterium]
MTLSGADIARLIDHTLLKPEASREQIARLCDEARRFCFASVCVNPVYVKPCAELLHDLPDIKICTVIGFPLGATLPEVKAYETEQALANGATEIDMVQQIGALKSHNYDLVRHDICGVVEASHAHGALCKVILETGLLTDEEKEISCQIAQEAGADFVKTSTGFGPGGATSEDIILMRRVVGPTMGVKASGGVRTYADVLTMLEAGATRIGASAGVKIIEESLGQKVAKTLHDSY